MRSWRAAADVPMSFMIRTGGIGSEWILLPHADRLGENAADDALARELGATGLL